MTLTLKISAKKLNNKVNYTQFDKQVFHNGSELEVIEKELEAIKSNKLAIYGSALGMTLIPLSVSAETVSPSLTGETITPETIFQFGLTIGLMGLGVSFAIAIIMFIYTGILKMLKQRERSKEWTTDIIKGFMHCLVAIPTIIALYYLSTSVFGSLFDQLGNLNQTFLNMP